MSEYRAKYKRLKAKLKYLVYEQECFVEEMRKTQRKLVRVSRDKSFLLDRLIKYETVPPSSSDDEATASSSSDDELHEMKLTHPKAKKRSNDDPVGAPSAKMAALGGGEVAYSDGGLHGSEEKMYASPLKAPISSMNSTIHDGIPSSRVKKMSMSEVPESSHHRTIEHETAILSPTEVRRSSSTTSAAIAAAIAPPPAAAPIAPIERTASTSSSESSSSSGSSTSSESYSPPPPPLPMDEDSSSIAQSHQASHHQQQHQLHHHHPASAAAAVAAARATGHEHPADAVTHSSKTISATTNRFPPVATAVLPAERFSSTSSVGATSAALPTTTRVQLPSHPVSSLGGQHRPAVSKKTFHVGAHPPAKQSSAPSSSAVSGSGAGASASAPSAGASQCKYMLDETRQCTESVNMKSKSPFCTHHRSIIRKKGQAQQAYNANAARKLPRAESSTAVAHGHIPASFAAHSVSYPGSGLPSGSHGSH
ncbi:uncharacterized protein LOC135814677 isoform X2 [Sycon ciliatum]|uniref:uncharacterized protein LOC135814677 isoform X2 n=1 Tax=Sycon ciliatum TaxID=27933 RepID=UPI0031F6B548